MKTLVAIAAAALHSTLLFACAPTDSSSGGEPATFPVDPKRILETCSGSYDCVDQTGGEFTIDLFPGEEACLFADATDPGGYPGVLDPGKSGLWHGESGEWTATPWGFQACFGSCFSCDKKPEPAAGTASGRCKGAADACGVFGAGFCSAQKGCYMASKVKYDGSLEYHCTGTPVVCSAMFGEQACTGHGGCVWETE